ncbi:hypothetical protein ACSAZL_04480 [Methanosarcina sp. T3]|uniref:hypothetical protein n=1 Tax=Methanosarcina sp. T3 TaxID=3439062 RepID=UPI003F86D811
MGFSQLHLNKNTSLQVTKTKLDSLQRAGMELMIHMRPNCHIQYDRYQPVLQYNHCCNNQKIEYGG